MPKWLRVTSYFIAGAMGLGGAVLGFSKPLTMVAALGIMAVIEAINYLW